MTDVNPDKKIVWMNCKATPGCDGRQAEVVFTLPDGTGVNSTRYRCQTCNRVWHLQMGGATNLGLGRSGS